MSDPTDKAKARFELLRRLGAGSSAYVDPELDALAAHAADIAGAPVGLVTFLDEDRQWLAGEHGFGRRETPLEWSFCRHAIVRAEAGLWVVGDAFLEPLVKDTALVQAERPVRFYAGVVIETQDQIPLGAVCVIDYEPRTLDQRTERTLRLLAREVATHLELRLSRQSLRRPTGIHDPAHPTPGGWDPRHARFFYATPQPMWVFDVETLSFLAVNDAAVSRYGWSREEFLRMTIRDIRPAEDVARLETAVDRSTEEPHSVGIWRHRTRSGEELQVEISSQPIELDGRRARLTIAVDVTSRLAAESRLRASEASLELAQRIAHLGSWELDIESGALTWSDETFRMFGHQPRAFMPTYAHFIAAVHPEDRARMEAAQADALRGLRPLDIEHRIVRSDGETRWVHEVGELQFDERGVAIRLTGTTLDITERHTINARLTRINRLYRMLSKSNEAIVRTERLDELVSAVLRVAVEEGGFAMAALVEVAPAGTLRPLAIHGHDDGYFAERSVVATSHIEDAGPIARALRSGRRDYSNDLANDPFGAQTREVALRRGYRSKAAFPVRLEGSAARVLVFFSRETGYFQEDELALLNAVADDLSYAADVYRRDAQRARVEGELAVTRRQTQLILESIADGIHGLDRDGRILFENPAAKAMFGRSAIELHGMMAHELIYHHRADGTPYPREACPIHQTLRDGLTRHVDGEVFFRKDGTPFPVEYVCSPLSDESGQIVGAVVSFRDVSERRRRERLEALEAALRQASADERKLGEIAQLAARGLEEMLEGVRVSLAVMDQASQRLTLMAAPGMADTFIEEASRAMEGADLDLMQRLGHEGEALVLPQLTAMRPPIEALGRRYGFSALASTPIVSEAGHLVALATLFFPTERGPSEMERQLVRRTGRAFADVYERELRRRAARERDDLLRRTFADAAIGIAMTDLSGRFVTTNDSYRRMLGYTERELAELTFSAITYPADRERNLAEVSEILEGRRESAVVVKRYVKRDGTPLWTRLSVALIRDAEGRPSGLIGVAEDIDAQKKADAALADAVTLVSMAGRVARLGGWTVDLGARAIRWSDEVCEIHELPSGHQPTDEEATDYYHPQDRQRILSHFIRCAQQGEPFDSQFKIITAKGRERAVRVIGEPVRDERGVVVSIRGAMQDVTDQARLELEARRLTERLRATLESITDAFYILDLEWRFTFLNDEAERLMERPADELLGEEVWRVFPDVLGTPIETHYREARATGRSARFEVYYPPLSRWFDVSAYPSSEGLAVNFRDITAERKNRERLREQAELIDRAQDAILVRDLDHYIRSWNAGAARLYGWTAEEAVGQNIRSLLYDDTTAFNRGTDAVLAQGEWTGELEQLTRDGRRVTVMARWSLVRDSGGQPLAILAINSDITEKKKLEQSLLRAQRLESIGTLAGGIAHDLNNVLAPILMVVSALASEETDPERREDFATIERCAERGAHMVKQLLVFARGHGGQMSTLQLGDIASDVTRMMRDTLPKNIGVRLEIAPDLWEVRADPTQMHQVLTNLCVNARDAMPLGGLLTIALEPMVIDEVYAEMHHDARPGAYVLLRVEDTGTGMPAEVLERMFEPFFTTKEIGKGTGLGLSTVHAIVRGHSGFINVYSEVGKGTRFRIYLPADPPESSRAEVEEVQLRLPRGRGELILLVDDEEMIRNVASRTLERHGYRTMTAANGAEAIATFVTHRDQIALVLTDMAMPVMDGPATIIALRAMEPGVRIVGSSGLNANGSVVRAMDAGVRHFVPKPYTTEGLLRVVRRALTDEG